MVETFFNRLVPERPDVVPTVGMEAVWRHVAELLEASPARSYLFALWAEREVAADRDNTDHLQVQETAVAILNICLRNGLFTARVDSGTRFYKLPAAAFVPRTNTGDGLANADASTWSRGVLHRIDTTPTYDWIADNALALLVTEGEFDIIRRQAQEMISEGERQKRKADRDRILDRAERGEISAREADAEAARLGLDPLQARPEAERFDPRQRPAWTLPMVLGWIAWRDFEEVRAWDPDYRHECWDWTTSDRHPDGRRLIRRRAATVWEFETSGYLCWSEREKGWADRELDADLGSKTKRELWRALQEGSIMASGIPNGGRARQDVPAMEWEDLETHREWRVGGEYFSYRHKPGLPAYHELRIPRVQVIGCWPERASLAPAKPPEAGVEANGEKFEAVPQSSTCVATDQPANSGEAWRFLPGARMANWIENPPVRAEAERRREGPSKKALANAFMAMGEESGARMNRESILAAMRKSPAFR